MMLPAWVGRFGEIESSDVIAGSNATASMAKMILTLKGLSEKPSLCFSV
jgi:hypothetical protein